MQPLQICIGPTIRIGRESWCLPYAGFFFRGCLNREYQAARACSRLKLFFLSFQGTAWLKEKLETGAGLGFRSSWNIEYKLGSGLA